jgi:hypothetical protein
MLERNPFIGSLDSTADPMTLEFSSASPICGIRPRSYADQPAAVLQSLSGLHP